MKHAELKYWKAVGYMVAARVIHTACKVTTEVGIGVSDALETLAESLYHRALKTSDEVAAEHTASRDIN